DKGLIITKWDKGKNYASWPPVKLAIQLFEKVFKFKSIVDARCKTENDAIRFTDRNGIYTGPTHTLVAFVCCKESTSLLVKPRQEVALSPTSKIYQNMINFWKNGSFSDASITVGEKSFQVSRALLASRSPQFFTPLFNGAFNKDEFSLK